MMEAKETFLSYLNALDDDYYFFIATMVLGKVQTPYHKPVLNTKILSFLMNQENKENIMASLDLTDLKYLSLTMLIGRCTLTDIHEFFHIDSYPLVVTRMDSLCDRLILLRENKVYSVNPVLKEDLKGLYRSSYLFEESDEPANNLPFVDRNVLFAMLNLLSNGSVPVREANAHHFTRTDKLDKVFPQATKEQAVTVYESIKAMALDSGAISIASGRYILNPEKAKVLTRLDSLNLMLSAIEHRISLPSKCDGMGLSASCSRLLGILKSHCMNLRQAMVLLEIFTGLDRIKDAKKSNDILNDVMDMMYRFGFIAINNAIVHLNPAVMAEDIAMSRTSLDTNLVVSYYGTPSYDDILYIFSDVLVCDKMASYVICKESYNRALSLGITEDQIIDYLKSEDIKAQLTQWKDSFSRITLYDGILIKCDSAFTPVVMMHPDLQEHIIQRIDENLFLMRRSTFHEWQSILAYALDMHHLPIPVSEVETTANQSIISAQNYEINDVIPPITPKETIKDWSKIEAELIEYASKLGCLTEDVKELIKAKLIVSKDQIGKGFKYASMPTISGFDFNAKITAIKSALKGKSSLMRIELPNETVIVKPVEVSKGDARNSVLKVEVLPDGLERNIPVSSIFRITVLRWSIN